MSAHLVELAVETIPLVLLGIAIYRMLLRAAFHNTKYLPLDESKSKRA